MTHTAEPRQQRPPLAERGQIEHHAADMVVTAAADVPLEALQAHLAGAGQWLAIDGRPSKPLKQLVLENSTGPLRLGYGGWRDFLTGAQFRDGPGQLVTVGGVTMKNVAGYDLGRFLVGSHGCFGKPVTLTCRTYRRPEGSIGVNLGMGWSAERVSALLAGVAPPQWLLLTQEGLRAGWLGRLRELESLRLAIADLTGQRAHLRDLESDEAERQRLLDVGVPAMRVVTTPAGVWRVMDVAGPCRWVADPAFGIAWLECPERLSEAMTGVLAIGGHATWMDGIELRTTRMQAGERRLLERLKVQFDPEATLPPLPKEE